MLEANADSNLLFGMTALQMDFISRDQLMEAMQAWTFDKSRHLGDILIDQAALTESQRAVLAELVTEHLKKHNDNAQKSLAAIPPDSSINEALESIKDPDVQDSLIHFAITQTADTYATRYVSAAGDDAQRFRILRPHAQGGLGQISVALDKELHREVALKELQMKYASNEATRERFMLEAEITGGLEHPSIVPVYGLGHYSDGRPYYAMRFIRGDNLEEAIDAYHRSPLDAKNLELHKLLRRFIDVCDAVHYAHSRGVLHRDLKPGNIMLGKYGETLLVDWGLAKPIDGSDSPTVLDGPPLQFGSGSGSAPTSMGSVVGTPGYMSPEQAAGRLDLLGPASDVYGLGATLYHLLTGEAPFRDKLSDVLKKIERGEFRHPRQVNSRIPQSLEAICLHAMSRSPEDRYSSAASLADDVEHWLADETVSVWQETPLQRLSRWTRRHWTAAVSVASIGCAALVVLAIGVAYSQRAYRQEQRQHEIVRQVVDDYFTDVSESMLLNQPGSQSLRSDLLGRALSYYERFAADHAQDETTREELARAHYRIGLIKEATDSPEASLAAIDQAIALQETLVAEQPQDEQLQYAFGLSINARGRLLLEMKEHEPAIEAFKRAITVRQQLFANSADNVEFARLLANSHMNLGECYRESGDSASALDAFAKSRAIRQPFMNDASNAKLARDFAKASYNLGNLATEATDNETAETYFTEAIARLDQLDPLGTGDLEMAEMLALSHRRMADMHQADSNQESAIKHYLVATKISGPLAFNNPSVRQYQSTHAGIATNYASLLASLDRIDEAIAKYEDAEEIVVGLVKDYPTAIDYQLDLITIQTNLGRLYLWLERPGDATGPLESALQLSNAMSESTTSAESIWARANCYFQAGRHSAANADYLKAHSLLKNSKSMLFQLTEDFPTQSKYAARHQEVELEVSAFMDYSRRTVVPDTTITPEMILKPIEDIPTDEDRWRLLAPRLHTMGRLQWAASKLTDAIRTLRKADRVLQPNENATSANSGEQQAMIRGDQAAIWLEIGGTELNAGHSSAAKDAFEKARDLLKPLAETHPDDEFFRRDLQAAEAALNDLAPSKSNE